MPEVGMVDMCDLRQCVTADSVTYFPIQRLCLGNSGASTLIWIYLTSGTLAGGMEASMVYI